MEQYDLTALISPHLDRHLVLPLLEYTDTCIAKGIYNYDNKDVDTARLSLLRPTHMVDYAIDIYKNIHGADATIPQEMLDQKSQVYQELEKLRAKAKPLEDLCNNTEERTKLVQKGEWNVASLVLKENLGILPDTIETYRQLAKYNYECGDYQAARTQLANYISLHAKPPVETFQEGDDDLLAPTSTSTNTPSQQQQQQQAGNAEMYYLETASLEMLQVLWGKLACEILVEDLNAASIAVTAVKTCIEELCQNKQLTPLQALEERTWLLHWSLFCYWNDVESLVNLCMSDKYKQAITTNAPHLLRYLVAAVLIGKRDFNKKSSASETRRLLKNLVQVMQNVQYTDPICDFMECLLVKFDFERAQIMLKECQSLLESDFFLCKQVDVFMEEARVFAFENYCRIHDKIDLSTLSSTLAMPPDLAERWIVDLIRHANLDAKFSAQENCVIMGGTSQSIYQQVMERTRDLNVRSATLTQNLNNMLQDARKAKAKKERAAREEE